MANPTKIYLVVADFYQDIARDLITGARAVLENYHNGANPIIIAGEFTVPGALEIPAAIRFLLNKEEPIDFVGRRINNLAFVALGCVIRGETSHYDIVANESARGLQELALHHKAVIGNGILTVNTMEQARIRANPHKVTDQGKGELGNKGGLAARACLRLLEIKQQAGLLW